ncbi:RagB/SusD family nutrient uptake outer membrane protein [Flavobacterium sp. NG2]|uniref:RagB/SusD family nutrient uptake outer membrane protein n=1 Tax=Flavobacterium sp. NG2 TaxID=3097547 RepID=UPI002A839809|nr:RagB/SusD family nutrient uptake outer membrane protein [Flavobacterium sp. NG2]WPR73026.1 RagB/SusD family nutrient uptake outer membrane protein [Flavobacterium sp. NG2]
MIKLNKYRKYITQTFVVSSFFLGLTMTFQSCADLNEDPAISNQIIKKYSNVTELENAVTGIYGQLRSAAWMTTFYVSSWAGDDITTHAASNKADFREFDQRNVTPENSRVRDTWSNCYSMIRAANTVLASSEGLVLADKAAQDRLIGETYFLRGTLFLHLTRIHGRIPLTLDVSTPEPKLTLASQVDVYKQIETDLLKAESLLPAKYPGVNPGAPRPNSGSARALLARLYMDWAGFPVKDNTKYATAASSAKKVIDEKVSHGFELVSNLENLWTVGGRFNTEGIFTISYCKSCGVPNRKFGMLGMPGDFAGWQETFAEIRFFEDFPEGPRKKATYITDIPVEKVKPLDPLDQTYKVNLSSSLMRSWTQFTDQQNPLFKKIIGPLSDNNYATFETDRNDYYMRYAEVLLIFAEASGRSGNITAASWEALNQIRRRAAGKPFATADPTVDVLTGDIAELAFTERKWELAGEFLRWNDLVRMERVQEALGNRNPRVSIGTTYTNGVASPRPITTATNPIKGSLGTDNYFSPIPAGEVAKHPELKP